MNPSDEQVIRSVRGGDTEAYRHLVERHRARLYAFLWRILGESQLAEEIAHDTFVKAYLALPGFRGDAKFGTWLFQIGLHTLRDRQRRLSRRRRVISLDEYREANPSADPPATDVGSDPWRNLEGDERSRRFHEALAGLPGTYREAFVLKHVDGWSYQDIASMTGDSVGTLKVRVHRARGMLRDALAGRRPRPRPRKAPSVEMEDDHGRTDRTLP